MASYSITIHLLSQNNFFYSLHAGCFCTLYCHLLIFYKNFQRILPGIPLVRVLNRLDPDQARHVVGPNLGPKCVLMLSAEDTRVQKTSDRVHMFR